MKQKILFVIVFLISCSIAQAQTIITVAGSTTGSYLGDGGPATNSNLWTPRGLAIDAAGNFYIADQGASRVRKVNSMGIITTVAGNGLIHGVDDGGPATAASVGANGVTFDHAGNMYIADNSDTAKIRMVNTAGIITTIAGGNGIAYIGDGGPATSAGFSGIYDVAIDGKGNIFASEPADSRIRKIDPFGIISTYAGTGTAGYNGDNISATSAQINAPKGLAVDDTGNLYICDYLNRRVRKIDTFGVITTVAGNGTNAFAGDGNPATAASLTYPAGIAKDPSGNIYISDGLRVRKINTSGIINTIAGNGSGLSSGDGGLATSAGFEQTAGIKVGPDGSIYIADEMGVRVRKILPYVVHVGITSSQPPPEERELCVWPNPTGGAVSMQVNTTANEPVHVVVTNVLGQKVKELTITTNTATKLQIKQPGIYFINAHTEREHWVERVVVE